MAEFKVTLTKLVEVEEERVLSIRYWSMTLASNSIPASLILVLAPKDDEGNWIESFIPLRIDIHDDPTHEDENQRRNASNLIELLLDAIVTAPQYGIDGVPVRDAGQIILRLMGLVD